MQVYTGKEGTATEMGHSTNVVLQLTEALHNKYHQVYFDNFFTSKQLLKKLLEKDTYACGTARQNRIGFPDALRNPGIKKREIKSNTGLQCNIIS